MQETLTCLVGLYSALAQSGHHEMWTLGCQIAQLAKKTKTKTKSKQKQLLIFMQNTFLKQRQPIPHPVPYLTG